MCCAGQQWGARAVGRAATPNPVHAAEERLRDALRCQNATSLACGASRGGAGSAHGMELLH